MLAWHETSTRPGWSGVPLLDSGGGVFGMHISSEVDSAGVPRNRYIPVSILRIVWPGMRSKESSSDIAALEDEIRQREAEEMRAEIEAERRERSREQALREAETMLYTLKRGRGVSAPGVVLYPHGRVVDWAEDEPDPEVSETAAEMRTIDRAWQGGVEVGPVQDGFAAWSKWAVLTDWARSPAAARYREGGELPPYPLADGPVNHPRDLPVEARKLLDCSMADFVKYAHWVVAIYRDWTQRVPAEVRAAAPKDSKMPTWLIINARAVWVLRAGAWDFSEMAQV